MKMNLLLFLALPAVASAADAKPVPDSAFPQDVRVERNVAYLPEGRKERADLYFPKDMESGKKYPAVLIIHGGGFTGGQRDAARELNIGGNLARNGYIAMSIDYLLSSGGKVTWPQNLHDCKTAVRWLRANAGRLQVDADHIGVIGGSAGGHLAAMVGLTIPADGLEPQEPYGDLSSRVSCAVDLYGPAEFGSWHDVSMLGKKFSEAPGLYKQASPVTYARKDSAPMLILHGTSDTTVSVDQSRQMAAACKAAGMEHELVIVQGAPHSFHLQPKERDLRPLVLGFFDKHLKPAK
jgi:acetyl esterase/lipase